MCVDDCLFFAWDAKDIDLIIRDLQNPEDNNREEFLLNKEDDVAGFFGYTIPVLNCVL